MSSSSSTNGTTSSRFTCEQCEITFNTPAEKEEHIKSEHSGHKTPSGVS